MKRSLKDIKDRCEEVGDCWMWTQCINTTGYPQASIDGKGGQMVRRVALELSGKFPSKKNKRATWKPMCGKLCCNPEHGHWGSHSASLKETYASGKRSDVAEYLRALRRAQHSFKVKLDWGKVAEIRCRLSNGETCAALGKEYGVRENTIQRIKQGRTWRCNHYLSLVAA